MIVGAAPLVARGPPAADVALWYRIRVGGRQRTGHGSHHLHEPIPYQAVVGEVLAHPVRFPLETGARRDDVHVFRHRLLNRANQLGVEAKLQDRSRPGLTGQLGIQHFIGPLAQHARPRHPEQSVRPPIPGAVRERRLDDHVGAVPHCRDGGLDAGAPVRPCAGYYSQSVPAGMLEILFLVLEPTLLQDLQRRVAPARRAQFVLCRRHVEHGQVAAAQMISEVARRQLTRPIFDAHRCSTISRVTP